LSRRLEGGSGAAALQSASRGFMEVAERPGVQSWSKSYGAGKV
jgi:hypothetical protein